MQLKSLQIYIFTVFVFFAFQPFFVWERAWLFTIISALFLATCIYFKPKRSLNLSVLLLSVCIATLFIYLMIPFRKYDVFNLKHILYMSMLLLGILWLNKDLIKVWNNVKYIVFIITSLSLVSTFMFYLNVPFPDYQIQQETRLKDTDVYKVYYGMIYLNTQLYNVSGVNIIRNIGWFGEPGHFGLYLCLFLAAEKEPFTGKINKTLVLGILSTFSAAAYLILILILVIKSKKANLLIKMLFLSPIIMMLFFIDGFIKLFSFMTAKFSSDDVLDERAHLDLSMFHMDNFDILFGLGNQVLEEYEMYSSDIRAFVLKYGLLSIAFILLGILPTTINLLKTKAFKTMLVFLLVVFAIALHRSWMIDTFYMWFFILIILLKSIYINQKDSYNEH